MMSFKHCFLRKRDVHGHLIPIEVGVECRTYKGVNLNRRSVYKDWLKRLNTQPMKRRCTIENNRMILDYFFQKIPDLWARAFCHPFSTLNIMSVAFHNKCVHNEWLE